MRWNTPDFEEINLSGEVTSYANTDDEVRAAERSAARNQQSAAPVDTTRDATA